MEDEIAFGEYLSESYSMSANVIHHMFHLLGKYMDHNCDYLNDAVWIPIPLGGTAIHARFVG